ncbi:hypothetical protein JHS3_22360 [Jeongeupia sp. HS-3]|uniref:NAD(P)H-hydrate dehydratase n=1 Tax=Jeongeupia sp. HS-3 TaxID=1009682 RepID=UPI0018A4B44F|nr:NAD(P)H-hydrate dehydratase [Jeongeupia sp. HS-3]BCL76500.1 hypothetical protein JHS3_22360 [Jeongeupia sp. HS-3]
MLRAGIKLAKQTDISVAAIGPGLGQSDVAADLLRSLLDSKLPLLLDADALNLLAQSPALQSRLQQRQAPSIITPHPAEAARLLGVETRQVQQDRLTAAQLLIAQFRCTIVLKGSGTICGNEQGLSINASGNGALAAAGQGDVLSGLIAALLVQGLAPLEAAQRGVFVHGVAADEWRCTHPNGLGLCTSELIDPIRFILNR